MNINEYQEALNHISELAEYTRSESSVKPYKDKLQELVDKETPLRVIKLAENKYSCQKCAMAFELKTSISNMFVNNQYCNVCGQKIDWSGEE